MGPVTKAIPIRRPQRGIELQTKDESDFERTVLTPNSKSFIEFKEFRNELSLWRYSEPIKQIKKAVHAIGIEFHGLTPNEVDLLVDQVASRLAERKKTGIQLEKKGKNLRTVYYNQEGNTAFIFLKTKGGLTANTGGYRRGTRALQITWTPARLGEVPVAPVVLEVFQRVSKDDKAQSDTAHAEPFETRVRTLVTPEEYEELNNILLPVHAFFRYQKGEIPKTCIITPACVISLADFHARGMLGHQHAVLLAYDVLSALKTLHNMRIVHGDVKSANILLTKEGRAKLADFDFAFAYSHDERPIWADGRYATITHSSPELLRKEAIKKRNYPKCDIYAFAIDLFKIAYGKNPPFYHLFETYSAFRQSQTLEQILELQDDFKDEAQKAAKCIHESPDETTFLQLLALTMMHPDPNERFSAADACLEITGLFEIN